jgi:hypothetical protein
MVIMRWLKEIKNLKETTKLDVHEIYVPIGNQKKLKMYVLLSDLKKSRKQ